MALATLGIRGLIGAVWTGALAVTVLPLLPSEAPKAQPMVPEHLQALLARHDVRYVLKAVDRNATDCLMTERERGR